MSNPTLIMLVGLPCSGKSTEVQYLKKCFDAEVISTDDFIEARAKKLHTTYNAIFEKTIGDAVADMENRLKEAVKARKSIIWDQTNLEPTTRKKKLSKIPEDYYPIAYVFNEDFELLLERNAERSHKGKTIPHDVLLQMKKRFKIPKKEEGFREVIFKNVTRGGKL